MPATPLSGLLPVKISGRHYGENLARLDLLLSSLVHFAPGLLDELLVVARADEAEPVGAYLDEWPDLPIRMVIEEEHFPAFRRHQRPWQVRPWQRQQIIKLNAPAMTRTPYVLTLDPDVIAVKPVDRDLLLPGGRALLEPEPRSVHPRWWRDSADILAVSPNLEDRGINVTPAILSTEILTVLQQRLEAVGGRAWMDVLLTSYCDWTEYTLYLLAAQWASLVSVHHVWADDPGAPAHLHTDPELSIWGGASDADVGRLFSPDDPGLCAVVQSSSGISASRVAEAVAQHVPVRRTAKPPIVDHPGISALRERARVASRVAAQQVFRWRRALRGTRRGARRP